jgi:ABC-type Mn2+/Zn2+ transport system ATPase subunit
MKTAISVKNLTVAFNEDVVLNDISFDIEAGSICAVIGPNGSGKTTLLKAILGLLPIKKGEIKIFGQKIKDALSQISYVPQRFSFDKTFPITVEEFLNLALKDNRDKNAVAERLQELEMQNFKNYSLGALSGGQLQRVLIARSLLNDPKILFLDEPVTGIDIGGERTFYELAKHLNKDHKITIVLVSHELDIVYKFADQVICLNKKLICQGVPEKVLTGETIAKLYGPVSLYKHHHH